MLSSVNIRSFRGNDDHSSREAGSTFFSKDKRRLSNSTTLPHLPKAEGLEAASPNLGKQGEEFTDHGRVSPRQPHLWASSSKA